MGAKHPQDLVKKSQSSHFDFIAACNFLVRSGVVKSPADALRYIEENNSDINDLLEKDAEAIGKPVLSATELEEIYEELL